MREPVDPRAARVCGKPVDFLNERPANAFAARCLDGEEILQVAGGLNGNGAAMKDEMYEPEYLA